MGSAPAPENRDGYNALRRLVAGWFLMLSLFGWLPLLRALFDGPSYSWGAGYFAWSIGGSGVTATLWFPTLKCLVAALVVWAVLRNWRPVAAIAATIITAMLLASDLYALVTQEAIWFHGDTLGIRLNVSWLAPSVTATALVACIALWMLSVRRGPSNAVPLDTVNRRRLLMLTALLPVQFVLLRFGVPHGATDAAGVILTILQWMMLGWALAQHTPGIRRTEQFSHIFHFFGMGRP
jgi:hypothetical protein